MNIHYVTMHDMTWHVNTLHDIHYIPWYYIRLHVNTWHDMKWNDEILEYMSLRHDITGHCVTLPYMTPNSMTLHYLKWQDITWKYMTLRCMTWHCITLHDIHDIPWYYIRLHVNTWHDMTLNDIALESMSLRHDITGHCVTLPYMTPTNMTLHENTWRYDAWHDMTLILH